MDEVKTTIKLAGREYEQRDMIRQVLLNLKRYSKSHAARWVAVMHAFAISSTAATDLCNEFGLDPQEILEK